MYAVMIRRLEYVRRVAVSLIVAVVRPALRAPANNVLWVQQPSSINTNQTILAANLGAGMGPMPSLKVNTSHAVPMRPSARSPFKQSTTPTP